ncbi:FHA domain-containing protein [Kribbella solani]|uniref:PSer/pThr/pTyr-binding forkhead associated (FHA) protein n=1 Tax=Kribbella solani TaxID=236067 RepID=A0A841DTX0_9ACTN|nr:FHA domain-containing protein [Kribbella solani]MBB5978778.1 pSer/pThr/pTyr-binding forkhead associated (FHA) protein [Kribbella solani]MDX2968794.1 FHA domain-containing protein [Kribbella solani]MDX3000503.1 FHA domain-containing protein [Kribbella solani]
MPFCNQCGHENSEGSRFCSQCGAMLPGADRPAAAPATPQPMPQPGVTDTAMLTPIGAEPEPEQTGEPLTADDEAAVGALPAGSALLIVQRGPNAGSRFLLDVDVVTAGRHPDSDIFLDDVTVSRRHAEFRRDGYGVKVRDVGSLNGTYVNRDRIDEVRLNNGDEVQIGKYRLVYYASGQA